MKARTLILLRHAKSSWKQPVPDHDRPLSGRGQRDAPAVGRLLRERGMKPDLVLCSPAVRTRQTWQLVHGAGVEAGEVRFVPEIYGGRAEDLRQVLRTVPEGTGTVLLIGHAPGLPDLADSLAGPDRSPAAARMRAKFPTAGLALFAVTAPWAELERAELLDFQVPRPR